MNIEALLGPAADGLSNRAATLLATLVNDTCKRLPEHERSILKVSGDALIYNLFMAKTYVWSYNDYREIFNAIARLKAK